MHLGFISDTHSYLDSGDNVYSFTGCTLPNLIKFNIKYGELHDLWACFEGYTVQEAYISDARFRYLCDECLRLNGIDPANVSALSLSQLLITHVGPDGEVCHYGALIPINKIEARDRDSDGEILTISSAIAMVSSVTSGNALDAIELMERLNANDTIALVRGVCESAKTTEDKADDRYQDWKRDLLARDEALKDGRI